MGEECLVGIGFVVDPVSVESVDAGNVEFAWRCFGVGDQCGFEGRVGELGQFVVEVHSPHCPPRPAAVVEWGAVRQAKQNADASGGGLGTDVSSGFVCFSNQIKPVPPPGWIGTVLGEPECDGSTGADREFFHPCNFAFDDGAVGLTDHAVKLAIVVDSAFEYPSAQPSHHFAKGEEFLGGRPRPGYFAAIGCLMEIGA
jgi:hypothetical protein